ncbi:ATPase [Borrelia recurrentis]|uniref:ATPase n=1 Tax=Borrelia recurrentis TaxID=44449 RepID=UPI0002F857B0|nr:ATPase [Borrelia recurrentis]
MGLFAFEDESDNIRGILLLSLFYYLFGYKIKDDVISNEGCRDVLVAKFQASDEFRRCLFFRGILVKDLKTIIFDFVNVILGHYYVNDKPISIFVLNSIFNMEFKICFQNWEYLFLKNILDCLNILNDYVNLNIKLETYKLEFKSYIRCLNSYYGFILKQKLYGDNIEKYEKTIKNELKSYKSIYNSILNLRNVLNLDDNVCCLREIIKVICDAEYFLKVNICYFEFENCFKNFYYELEDIGHDYSGVCLGKACDENELELVDKRLYFFPCLNKKYGPNFKNVIVLVDKYSEIINLLLNIATFKLANEQKLNVLFENLQKLSFSISNIIKTVALKFASGVIEIFHKFNMRDVRFFVSVFEGKMNLATVGDLKFFISNYIALKVQSIMYRVASVGEILKTILTIQSVQSIDDNHIIVNGIDYAIESKFNVTLGKYLKSLSQNMHIFIVTYLTNIANFLYFSKEKCIKREFVLKEVSLLFAYESVLGIVRMLYGNISNINFGYVVVF